jgi:hypothetical protein
MLRKAITEYLCRVPLGTWPEFCAEPLPGRRKLLAAHSTGALSQLFLRTNWWYLRYAYHFLTAPLRRKPTFFLMGFPKCGTTYFADRLSLHPDIGTPTTLATIGKETMHYRKDQVAHAFMPLRGFYPIFSSAANHFDASVSYSYDPGAMTWIKAEHPDSKFILLVRDQVSAFESMMNYYQVRLWHKTADELASLSDAETFRQIPMDRVEEAIELTRQRQQSSSVTRRLPELRALFDDNIETAIRFMHLRYDLWVDMHYDVFGEESMLVLDFAEVCSDTDTVMHNTFEFLGLPAIAQGSPQRELKKNASQKVFRLEEGARNALREVFYPHNERLRQRTGIDLNRSS